jgi:cell division protease FtsH
MKENTPQKNNMPRFSLNWVYIVIVGVLAYLYFAGPSGSSSMQKEVNITTFRSYIKNGYAKEVVINKTDGTARLTVQPDHVRQVFNMSIERTGKTPTVTTEGPDNLSQLGDFVESSGVPLSYETTSNMVSNFFFSIFPVLLLAGLWFYFMRRMGNSGNNGSGGIFGVGKSRARLFEKGNGTHVTFKDVAGQESAKQEVEEIVDFLRNPKKYTDLGGKIPKGALLVGPPGTGKTLLAKAVAGEADVPFFSMAGSDFVEMFVGVGASRVRDLFRQAKEKAPCIIFIDEIDAVGRSRGKNSSFGGNDERENTLNQLLTEMDGFSTNSGVIILAATNRVEILDPALLRAGRFDRQIHVDLPELSERIAIFNVHLQPLKLAADLDVDFLARQTPGFSGADIANVCNEAALIAARHNRSEVGRQDFLDAVDRIIGGLEKKTKVLTQGEKHSIAIHEAGHAAVSWMLRYANPLVKVTIVPRGQALGAAWYLPEERSITTKEQMLDEICATLGGRAAEELFIGHISSGALNDLERVTKRAYGMVAYLGMSDSLSNLCYYNNQEYNFTKPYSEKTAERIDDEVKRLIAEQYDRAKALLSEHAEKHAALAGILQEREVIFTEDVERIFGKRPWKSRADELMEEQTTDEDTSATTTPDTPQEVAATTEEATTAPQDITPGKEGEAHDE